MPNHYYANVGHDASAHINIESNIAMHSNPTPWAGFLPASYHQPTSDFPLSCHTYAKTVIFAQEVPWWFLSPEAISQGFRWLPYWLSTAMSVCWSNLQFNQTWPASIRVTNVDDNYAHCWGLSASQQWRHTYSCIIESESPKLCYIFIWHSIYVLPH